MDEPEGMMDAAVQHAGRGSAAAPNAASRGQRALGWVAANAVRMLAGTLRYKVNEG